MEMFDSSRETGGSCRKEGILEECLFQQRSRRRRLLRVFGSDDGRKALEELEEYFEIDLPVFQGRAGAFDPLDAMRRDAYREVFLYVRHQLNLALREKDAVSGDNYNKQN